MTSKKNEIVVSGVEEVSGEVYDCTCGGSEHAGHIFGCARIQSRLYQDVMLGDTEYKDFDYDYDLYE